MTQCCADFPALQSVESARPAGYGGYGYSENAADDARVSSFVILVSGLILISGFAILVSALRSAFPVTFQSPITSLASPATFH
jgi:hypothetical protein